MDLEPLDNMLVNQAVVQGSGIRVVVSVFSPVGEAPLNQAARDQYCGYLGHLITRFPQINDLVIWNEPNLRFFWKPQFDDAGRSEAPARYVELLATCWDTLHALRPSVNIVAPAASTWGNDNPNAFSNVSHSPTSFIKAMGAAYRASGRTKPIFDTFGHHPYPTRSNERPWVPHADEAIVSLGDVDRLVVRLREAFGGTGQPTPDNGVPIWYLETGYQTLIDDDKQSLYTGVENWPGSVPDHVPDAPKVRPPDTSPAPDQATQLADSLRMMYCQPHIAAVFNFLIRDERELTGWQSGLLWSDGSRKDLVRRLPLDRGRGERAARRLRRAQGGAGRPGRSEHDPQDRRSGRDPVADEAQLPQPEGRALRVPAAARQAHARVDREQEGPGRQADPVPGQLDRVRPLDEPRRRRLGDADTAAEARPLPRRHSLRGRQRQRPLRSPCRRAGRQLARGRPLGGRRPPRAALASGALGAVESEGSRDAEAQRPRPAAHGPGEGSASAPTRAPSG